MIWRACVLPIALPLDLARAGGQVITPIRRVLIVEGNYLLLNEGLRGTGDLLTVLAAPAVQHAVLHA